MPHTPVADPVGSIEHKFARIFTVVQGVVNQSAWVVGVFTAAQLPLNPPAIFEHQVGHTGPEAWGVEGFEAGTGDIGADVPDVI